MTDHTCVRNPETGACFVCFTPMRLNFPAGSLLDASIDATQFPRTIAPPRPSCACGSTSLMQGETVCADCWIAAQTKQTAPAPPPAPKPVKQTKPTPAAAPAVSLDSILSAMLETNPNKWN
jgi:hypothetical protein